MMQKLQFKKHFRVEFVAPDSLFLLTETGHQVINDSVYEHIAPLLHGEHTISELLIMLSGKVTPPEVFRALNQLRAHAYLVEMNGAVAVEEAAFWHTLGVDVNTVPARGQACTVGIRAVHGCDVRLLRTALESVNVHLDDEAAADLLVVVTDDYLREDLAALNQTALMSGRRWLPVKLVGTQIWIGPLFEPGQTACWACLAERIRDNRQVETYLLRRMGQTAPFGTARAALDTTMRLGANFAATEIVKWIVQGQNPSLKDKLLTFNVLTTESQKHTVVRRPQCSVCGDPAFRERYHQPTPIVLASNKKRFRNDGGHRTLFPEEVYSRYQHHISPITGVITSLSSRTGAVNGITYSYAAVHPFPMVRDDMNDLRSNLLGRSGGKGMTDIQAKVSGMSEAFERYSGVYRKDEIRPIHTTYRELGEDALHLHDCLLFSEAQYANRGTWSVKQRAEYHRAPNAFNEETALDWSPVWSLTNEKFRYVPSVYCYYGHPDLKHFFCGSDANGCAAGSTVEEAIFQGFLELVERDGVALWWYNCVQRPGVDVESFGIPYFGVLQSYYQQLDRDIWVLDLTTDLNIPIFAAVSRRTDRDIEDIALGFGAHLDPKIAILRALTEVNQFLPVVMQREADGRTRYLSNDPGTLDWLTTATVAQQAYLLPNPQLPRITAADYPAVGSDDLRDDIKSCVARAQAVGLETLVLNQSLPDIGMKVCRVIVPGLRHFWRRLAPGRLYDVPVQLGWLNQPRAEDELNPYSMFF